MPDTINEPLAQRNSQTITWAMRGLVAFLGTTLFGILIVDMNSIHNKINTLHSTQTDMLIYLARIGERLGIEPIHIDKRLQTQMTTIAFECSSLLSYAVSEEKP